MILSSIDVVAFLAFLLAVIAISLFASRKEENQEDYFLAGRNLSWWLIGFSLIASNISTEQFVGMASKGYSLGLAVASWEWMSALFLVLMAWLLLPRFLSYGIYTMPEYLEYRYSVGARAIMACFMMVAYIFVALATVLYSGGLALHTMFGLNLHLAIWLIGIVAGAYTMYGGLKAVVWTDLFQGAALLLGGMVVLFLALGQVGGLGAFLESNETKLHTVLPWNHPELPWTAVFFGGMWIPVIYYWGLNQFITQRTLAARSLAEGQRGVIFGGFMKLLIPFIVVFPGMMAAQVLGEDLKQADSAYPQLLAAVLPGGLRGIMFAALFGAILSSMDSMLNSAATIFTVDLYQRHVKPDAEPKRLVTMGRIVTILFAVFACIWAPFIANFGQLFDYLQMVWGFISPGIVCVFLFGLVWKRCPAVAAIGAMLLNPIIYGACLYFMADLPFLHHMALTFVALALWMTVITLIMPLEIPRAMPRSNLELKTPLDVKVAGAVVLALTVLLYIIFW